MIYLPAPPANTELTTPPVAASFTALLLYEYLVTVDQEVRLFWTRPARAASLLFFVIRYWTLLNYVVFWAMSVAAAGFSDKVRVYAHHHEAEVLYHYVVHQMLTRLRRGASIHFYKSSNRPGCAYHLLAAARSAQKYNSPLSRCSTYHGQVRIDERIGFTTREAPSECALVLSALRVFALSGMNRPLSAFVFLLASVPAVTNMVSRVLDSPAPEVPLTSAGAHSQVAFKFGLTGAKVLTLGCIEQLDVTPLQHEMCVVPSRLRALGRGLGTDIPHNRLSVVTRASLTAADVIVVVVTIFATWSRGLPRVCTGACGRASLGDVLLYNGAHLYSSGVACITDR